MQSEAHPGGMRLFFASSLLPLISPPGNPVACVPRRVRLHIIRLGADHDCRAAVAE